MKKNILYRGVDVVCSVIQEDKHSMRVELGSVNMSPDVVTIRLRFESNCKEYELIISLTKLMNCLHGIFTLYSNGLIAEKIILNTVCDGDETRYLLDIESTLQRLISV